MSKFRNEALLQPGDMVTGEQPEQAGTATNIAPTGRAASPFSRRGFLATAGITGAAALAGCSDSNPQNGVTTPTVTPSIGDVLNFALNLEYLEATFYLTLLTGSGLHPVDMGGSPGAVTGGFGKVAMVVPGVQDLLAQLAADEQAHVQFLRATMQALSITPVDMPALNLSQLGPVTNDAQFLNIARALETTGTSAYEGAVKLLVSNTTALNYAATIHATEGQHEGALRQYIINNASLFQPATSTGVSISTVDSNDASPFGSNGAFNIFNTGGPNGLNTARDTSQVLQIVYGASGSLNVTSGGFYPKGFNGNIKST